MELNQSEEIPRPTNDETEKSKLIEEVHQIDEEGAKSDSETQDDFQECAICLEVISRKDMISLHNYDFTHACTHIYHEACIELVNIRWCPMCRRPFSKWKLCFPVSKPPEEAVVVNKSTLPKPIATAAVARPTGTVRQTQPSVGGIDRSRIDAERVRLNARLNYRPSTTAFSWHPPRRYSNASHSSHGSSDIQGQSPLLTRRSQRLPQPQTVQSVRPPPPPSPSASLIGSPTTSDAIVFPLELLKSPTLPVGVDPKRLELYLSCEDFQRTFKMSRDMFARLSKGQKIVLRRQNGLHR